MAVRDASCTSNAGSSFAGVEAGGCTSVQFSNTEVPSTRPMPRPTLRSNSCTTRESVETPHSRTIAQSRNAYQLAIRRHGHRICCTVPAGAQSSVSATDQHFPSSISMATDCSMATSVAAPTLPSVDFSRRMHSSNDSVTTPLETATLRERHDSRLTSPRSSLSSCSTDSLRTNPTAKSAKRVRFEESVCCSYFDINEEIPPAPPTLRRKPSFWERFKQKNISADQIGGMPPDLQALKRRNFSADLLEMDSRAAGKTTARSRTGSTTYSVQQPLRESAGRRYSGAETHACWRADTVTAKGDWGDLLSNPRQSQLIA